MKRFILMLLAAVMVLSMLAPLAYASETEETTEAAEETVETEATEETEETEETEKPRRPVSTAKSGTCGDLAWQLDGTTLFIIGSGEMEEGAPWSHLADEVKKLVLSGGVTTVAEGAFEDFDQLTVIDFGGDLKEIGARAFLGCDSLTTVTLPPSFRRFGPESFRDCSELTSVYCAGNMPSFKANCLYTGNYISIYRPVNNPWPQDSVQQLQQNFGGRLEVLAAPEEDFTGFSEAAEVPQIRQVPTEPETEPVTEPETEPVTEPATEPITEPTTEPATQPVTEPATVPTEVTEAVEDTGPDWREELEQTESAETEEAPLGGRSWIGLVLIIGVLTFVVAGALIVRGISRKNGRYYD